MKALFPKTVSFLKSNILGIIIVSIFCSIIGSFIYSWMHSSQTPNIESVQSVKILSKTLPQEIVNEIENRPPLQQEKAGTDYIGQRFKWHVILVGGYKSYNGEDTIMFREKNDKRHVASVFCNISKGKYPSLQTAKKGTEFYITGTVSTVRNRIIELSDTILE